VSLHGLESKTLPLSAVVLAIGLAASTYLVALDRAPVYIGGDEAYFAVHGHALATTGRDLNGTPMPLLFNLWDPLGDTTVQSRFRAWYQPLLFYLVALTLEVFPFTEWSIRLPTAVIGGVLSPWLMYVVAMRLFKDRRVALLAAMVLALSPSLLLLSRQTLDFVCPIPFVLGWLWCLITLVETGTTSRAFVGGLVLGLGFYSYVAAWLFMPACLALTWLTCARLRSNRWRAAFAATGGFLIPVSLLIPWAWLHPEALRETAGRYLFGGSITQMAGAYLSYFDPVFLFFRGGARLSMTTGRSGVFLLPAAVFIAVGLYAVAQRWRTDLLTVVLLGGFALAPIPATLLNERHMIQRELFVLPLVAAISGYGASLLVTHPRRWVRGVCAVLVIAMPLQFAYFYRDYRTLYQHRSVFYFDNVVFSDVAATFVAADPPAILVSHDVNDGGPRLRFHLTKAGRVDLLARTRYVDPNGDEPATAQPGSLLVVYHDGATLQRLAKTGEWSIVRQIVDIDQRPASVILRRN
jgi:4-amino-4-deoxy-L-arabinose transferase-like glycosyltransferase